MPAPKDTEAGALGFPAPDRWEKLRAGKLCPRWIRPCLRLAAIQTLTILSPLIVVHPSHSGPTRTPLPSTALLERAAGLSHFAHRLLGRRPVLFDAALLRTPC